MAENEEVNHELEALLNAPLPEEATEIPEDFVFKYLPSLRALVQETALSMGASIRAAAAVEENNADLKDKGEKLKLEVEGYRLWRREIEANLREERGKQMAHEARLKVSSKKAVKPYVTANFRTRHVLLENYHIEIPNEVKATADELQAQGPCAVLVLVALDSLGSFKKGVTMEAKSVLSLLPGAKLVVFPSVPVGTQKTIRKKPELILEEHNGGPEAASGGEGEDAYDDILDPLAVDMGEDMPPVLADGGAKPSRSMRLASLSRDKELTRKIMSGVGGAAYAHFLLSCPFHWEGKTRMNSHTQDCVVLVPEATNSQHDWVANSILLEGGMSGLRSSTEFVRVSKMAAADVALKGGVEVDIINMHRLRASRLQKDPASLKEIFQKSFRKLDKEKSVLCVNLFGQSQDWGVGFMEWAQSTSLKAGLRFLAY